jgi:predicted metal-binding membrane protein
VQPGRAGLFVYCVYGYLYPLTRGRTAGLRLLRSGDGIPNFLTVWVSAALILLNLDRFSAQPVLSPWWPFAGLVVVGPVLVFGALYQWQRRREGPASRESLQQRDILSEVEEIEVA